MKKDWQKRGRTDWTSAPRFLWVVALTCLLALPVSLSAEETLGVRPLLPLRLSDAHTQLPQDTQLLIGAAAIEQFLHSLDGVPPDWATVYGFGHLDLGHNERLFNLNRERDVIREGNDAFHRRIAFLWSGELSTYDPESGGFPVALGPKFTPTSWGVVRFKYEDLPGNLVAVPTIAQRVKLLRRLEQDQSVEIDVVMMGRLIPDESIVYDFSHDQEGLGLIMPVVRVEEIVYLLAP